MAKDGRRAWLFLTARQVAKALDRVSGGWLLTASVVVALGSFAAGLAPLALKMFVDQLQVGSSARVHVVPPLIAAYVAALLFQRLCEQVQSYAYFRGEQRLARCFATEVYAHILALPLPFHLNYKAGALAQVLSDGLVGLRLLLSQAALSVAPVVIQLAIAGTVLSAVVGPAIGVVLVAALLTYAVVFTWGAIVAHTAVRAISSAQVEASGAIIDGLMNIEAIKANTAERRYAQRYSQFVHTSEERWRVYLGSRLKNGLAVAGVFSAAVAATHGFASIEVLDHRMTLGAFVLVNAYILQLIRPLEMLGLALRDLGQGLAFFDKVGSLLAETPEAISLEDEPDADVAVMPADLRFESVSFAYQDRQTLSDVSFSAAPGQTIGIVGESGAGKSTLLRLALRFYEPNKGRILFDGQSLSDIPLTKLRKQIALVSQDTILFNDTIAANIGLAADAAAPETIAAAAARARLAELLQNLPLGLDTPVGERGLKLSGGERQRISIARAALRRARLVIFDEATAALDSRTERAVWDAMAGLAQSATTIIVTHRLSTVATADEILVLDKGRIIERGRHTQLLAAGGPYAQLWRAQTEGASEDRGGVDPQVSLNAAS